MIITYYQVTSINVIHAYCKHIRVFLITFQLGNENVVLPPPPPIFLHIDLCFINHQSYFPKRNKPDHTLTTSVRSL